MLRTTGDTIAFSPPLIVQREQLDRIVDTVRSALARLT
jgi:beta-alanine--pyruvate transaminase